MNQYEPGMCHTCNTLNFKADPWFENLKIEF
jgi:hypothetical protein